MELKYMKKFPKKTCNEGLTKSIVRHILVFKNMLNHDLQQGKFLISQEECSYCIIFESISITIIQTETY